MAELISISCKDNKPAVFHYSDGTAFHISSIPKPPEPPPPKPEPRILQPGTLPELSMERNGPNGKAKNPEAFPDALKALLEKHPHGLRAVDIAKKLPKTLTKGYCTSWAGNRAAKWAEDPDSPIVKFEKKYFLKKDLKHDLFN
jgi:hypothetical protein